MSADGALSGLRVVEFSSAMAGPWIGRFMAWAGAEVIRVESRKRPDVVRGYVPPWDPALGTQPEMSPWFTDWNAGKRFVSLDLTHPRAVELAKGMVAVSDLVVENQAAGVMDKLGLGYKDLSAVREDIIMISSSGFGDSGPASRHVTWGPNIEAASGLATATGFAGSDCTVTQYAYPDSVSAMHGLFAVMCALDHRRRSGQGQYINMSQYETLVSAIGHLVLEQIEGDGPALPCGNRARDRAPQGAYPCRGEDRWLVLSVDGEKDWKALGAVLERPDLGGRVDLASFEGRCNAHDDIDAAISAWTSERDAWEAVQTLQEAGVAAAVVETTEDQWERDRHLQDRGFFEQIEHLKKGKVVATGIPLGLTATPGSSRVAGQAVGQDNAYVFEELLGLGREEVEEYEREGVFE